MPNTISPREIALIGLVNYVTQMRKKERQRYIAACEAIEARIEKIQLDTAARWSRQDLFEVIWRVNAAEEERETKERNDAACVALMHNAPEEL